MLFAPLEQFQILAIIPFNIFFFDFSLTNFLLINLITLVIYTSFIYLNSSHDNYLQEKNFFLIYNGWQKSIESISEVTTQLISDIIILDNEKYVPFISMPLNFQKITKKN